MIIILEADRCGVGVTVKNFTECLLAGSIQREKGRERE